MALIARRMIAAIPVMAFVALIVFLMLRLAPGDPAAMLAGDAAGPERLAQVRESLGLDRPLHVQFVLWAGSLMRGDLGVSLISGLPVLETVAPRLGPTTALALAATLAAVLAGVPLGVLAAWRHGGVTDRAINAACVIGFSVPVFLVGYLLMLGFAVELRWLPVQGYRPFHAGAGPFLAHLALPSAALAIPFAALIARMTRAAMLDVLGEDNVRTARAKGLRERRVLFAHALPQAAVPVVTVIGAGFAILIGGVVVTESVFNVPGLGRLTVDAVMARDYPVIQAVILLIAAVYVVLNLVIDLLYLALDPRVRYR